MKCKLVAILLTLLLVYTCLACAETKYISPLDFGLSNAQTGKERYDVLLRCHKQALKDNCYVTYKGIDSIFLEIPATAAGIPLTDRTDFSGVTITVRNKIRDIYLFTRESQLQPINLTANQIDSGDMSSNDSLAKGLYIVVIEDKKTWVDKRIGYDYPHIRQDILLVENGRAKNKVVMPYGNDYSIPSCKYRKVTNIEKLFYNIRFLRTYDSTKNTGLIKITGEHDIKLKDVYVYTPSNSDLYGDQVIAVEHSTNVSYENVTVYGTYSKKDKFGYAFRLDNVWNYKASHVKANGNWGVYGTNNLNKVLLENCEINRFDIHNYGRDVVLKNCRFYKLYNSFSSTFGKVFFDHCVFEESIPYLNAGSYNSFVKVSVIFENCKFYLSKKNNYLVQMMGMRANVNKRHELSEKHIPDISIKNCEVVVPHSLHDWYILKLDSYGNNLIVEGANKIDVNNLNISGNASSTVHLQTDKIELRSPFEVRFQKVYNNGRKTYIK